MTLNLSPGAGVLFMKVGKHAGEELDSIVARKLREVDRAGMAFWGYGGNTCHPRTMVQPFAATHAAAGRPIHLVMEPMDSDHDLPPVPATDWSVDRQNWQPIPEGVDALGSDFALVIGDLRVDEFGLDLDSTKVALGPSVGVSGASYIRNRCDKACLEVTAEPQRSNSGTGPRTRAIGLVAELLPPYAVFLRRPGR